ncbi:TonB-dependent receptor plug domain-containing protein, partial [candidate division WOR-3 bacterium]|nr:TonB-dependent receptor plug domain-containing protein [candidate division WOR-3 bacterium]
MFKSFLTVIVIFTTFVFSFSQGIIKGYITDKQTGEKIEGINVIIQNTEKGDLSNYNGFFIIPNISHGNYNIIAKRIGYIDDTINVIINSNDTISMNFVLQPTSIKMEGIVVTATKSSRYIMDVPIRTEIITNKTIVEKNALTLYDALTGIPGVIVEQQCQYCNFSQIRLQGLGADHTQILIDNIPVYSGLASVYGLQQIGSDNIDHIEIVKGAGSALYGSSAIAGAINIITKKPSNKYAASINLQYGNNNKYNTNFSTSVKYNKFAIQFNAQKSGADAIDETSENGNTPDGISDMVKIDLTNLSARIYIYDILKSD